MLPEARNYPPRLDTALRARAFAAGTERECIFNYPIFRALGPLLCAFVPSSIQLQPPTAPTDERDDMMDECNAERWTMVS